MSASAATINANTGSKKVRGGRHELQKMNTMFNYLTESDWTTLQTGQLCEGIHCLAFRCIKLNATTLTEQSFVHLASVLQVARDAKCVNNPDLTQGFNIVRDLKRTLRSQRSPKTGPEQHIVEYPEMPSGLMDKNAGTYNQCYGQLALHGLLQIISSCVLCISNFVTMLSIATLKIQW